MSNSNNEGRVCDAVVRCIETRTGEIRTHICYPEVDRVGPPVDLRLKLGAQEYAIEHTRIELFDNQIKNEVIIKKIIDYFDKNITLSFPSQALYELLYPIDISLPDGNKRYRALKNLAQWVCENEKVLRAKKTAWTIKPYGFYSEDNSVRGTPEGFDCTFKLLLWPYAPGLQRKPGSLSFVPAYSQDMEPLHAKRLMRAFSSKCAKLQDCKAEGARTVLALESSEAGLTSLEFRGNLLPEVLAKHTNVPDEIFLVETVHDLWRVHPLKQDDGHWPNTGMPEMGQFYYDPITSDIPQWLDSIPQWMRDGLPLDTPNFPGWAPKTYQKDELNDLASK